jgi:hypothetical protein
MSGRFAVDTVAVDTVKHLALPPGPWSYRVFRAEGGAVEFRRRLSPDHPKPFQLTEECLAPEPHGRCLAAGVWVVIYRVFD